MDLKKYYGSSGKYLKEHEDYFSDEQLKKNVDFITGVLRLKKTDKILDLACGHGRHTIALVKRKFDVDGLDFSSHLINLAREEAVKGDLKINFYTQDIHNIKIKKKYDKIFLFFSEFGLFNGDKVLKNVYKVLKPGGLFLLDCDNVFRLIKYLINHPDSPYRFDFQKMELMEKKKKGKGVKYYTFPELEKMFKQNKFKIITVAGDYEKNPLSINSKRIIIVGKK